MEMRMSLNRAFDAQHSTGGQLTQRTNAIFLLAADILFLWMFLSAESIVQMAKHSQISGLSSGENQLVAASFAARWKHGMAGNSPLYMPGFFCVGIFTWLWSLDRRMREVTFLGLTMILAALPIAALLAPPGSIYAVRSMERITGLHFNGTVPGFTLSGIVVSLYTLLTWKTWICCIQMAIARRSIQFLAIPVFMSMILMRLRPGAINDLLTQWIADVFDGRPIAILSLVAVPTFVILLIAYQLNRRMRTGNA